MSKQTETKETGGKESKYAKKRRAGNQMYGPGVLRAYALWRTGQSQIAAEHGAGGSPMTRPLSEIAREINRVWPKIYFGAVPYLQAMASLDSIRENYGLDSGASIVAYFLGNAHTWRGADARRIKAELKEALKNARAH